MRARKIVFLSALSLFFSIFLAGLYSQDAPRGREYKIKFMDLEGNTYDLYAGCYALVIGISDYTSGWPKLPNAANDAEEVGNFLSHIGFEVTKLKDPTKESLIQVLDTFVFGPGHDPKNCLVIFFAGHGYTQKLAYGSEMGYIVPKDAPLPERDDTGFKQKAIDMQMIESYARRIEAKHALFIFDSCFSGSVFDMVRAVPPAISYKISNPVRQFITAGGADEPVPDRSIFKAQLLEGLRGEADMNKDGYVTGTELGEFLQEKVVNYSRNSQHPQYGKIRDPKLDKGDFVFVLEKDPKKQSVKSELIADVRLAQIPGEILLGYRNKIQELTAEVLSENLVVSGQVELTLSIHEEGKIIITDFNDKALSVIPQEKRTFINDKIQKVVSAIVMDPPKDVSNKSVRVKAWIVSYKCYVSQGKLVLKMIDF
jgi:hypothetical protein